MSKLRFLQTFLTLFFILTGVTLLTSIAEESEGCTAGEAFPSISNQTLEVDGLTRFYQLVVPSLYDVDNPTPTPLVFSFHDSSLTAGMHSLITGWHFRTNTIGNIPALSNNITVMPDGIDQRWHTELSRDDADADVAFVEAILEDVSSRLCIDQSRIFAAGNSTGGNFVRYLVCEMPGQFDAAGIVSILYEVDAMNCLSGTTTPVILFHGTEDVLTRFEGGPALDDDPFYAGMEFMSVEDATRFWAENNDCAAEPVEEEISEHVRSIQYQECDNNADVHLYIIEGGGHTWPGSPVDLARIYWFIGETTDEIDATDLMWEFFQEHGGE